MKANLKPFRRLVLTAAVLLVLVGLVQVAGVIPPVKATPYPLASPAAVTAFWVNVVFQILVATFLGLIAVRTTGRSRLPVPALGLLAFVIIGLGLALTSAAGAYRGDTPGLDRAAMFLYACAAADLVAAVLLVVAAFRLPRRT